MLNLKHLFESLQRQRSRLNDCKAWNGQVFHNWNIWIHENRTNQFQSELLLDMASVIIYFSIIYLFQISDCNRAMFEIIQIKFFVAWWINSLSELVINSDSIIQVIFAIVTNFLEMLNNSNENRWIQIQFNE